MASGYMGKILKVDLNTGSIISYQPEESEYETFIGGSGLGARIVSNETGPQTDPLGPENVLVFMTGPLTGTRVPGSGRHSVCAKSPLSGIWGESSCGGSWGARLKQTGYDGIIIKGRASKPVYLLLTEDERKILDATHLWGKGNFETQEILEQRHGREMRASSIGFAGENRVRFAGVFSDGKHARTAGRCGLGAVMGSKNLKAIVCVGGRKVTVHDEQKVIELNKEHIPEMVESGKFSSDFGTSGGLTNIEDRGDLPIRNWYDGSWKKGAEELDGTTLAKKFLVRRYACNACPIGCGRVVKIDEGPYALTETGGPEYETLGMLGSLCLIDDLKLICIANQLCNDYGIDTISTGAVIAFAMEAYEKGLLSESGVDLSWGSRDGLLKTIELIARREGIGDLLADGVRVAAKKIGGIAEEFAIHTKGLEFPAHDPRAFNSIAVGYATSNRGACHLQALSHPYDFAWKLPDYGYHECGDRFEVAGKGKKVALLQNLMAMMDSIIMCKFMLDSHIRFTDISNWVNAVTGWNMDAEQFMTIGERLYNLKRLYNVKHGVSRKDDTLPSRILTHYRKPGGAADNLPPLGKMLSEYYDFRGWDEMGIPTRETLSRLGL